MSRQRGFTYIGTLILIVLGGIALAGAGEVWHTTSQREKEKELLFVGNQFRQALALYLQNSPGAQRYPQRLEDLLEDPRHPNVRRYLRQIFVDPMTGKADWGLIRQPGGGIIGVHSLSDARPYKVANFAVGEEDLAGSLRYSDWRFTAQSTGSATVAATPVIRTITDGTPAAPPAPVTTATAPIDTPAAPSAAPAAAPASPETQNCIAQRAADLKICFGLKTAGGTAHTACLMSSNTRYGQCLQGHSNTPALRTQ